MAAGESSPMMSRRQRRRFGRHQVAELPPIAVVFCEHRTTTCAARGVARRRVARLPGGVSDSPFGTGLAGRGRDDDRAQPGFAARHVRACARPVRTAALGRGGRRDLPARGGSVAGPTRALVEHVLASRAVNVDETGWFTAHEGRTLWTATTPEAAIFRIAEDRHRDRLKELIGADFKGIVGSDRWWAYDLIDPASRQACWEHLKRDFAFHAAGALVEQKQFGEAGRRADQKLFETWHAFGEHSDRRRLAGEMSPDPSRAPRAARTSPHEKAPTRAFTAASPRTC